MKRSIGIVVLSLALLIGGCGYIAALATPTPVPTANTVLIRDDAGDPVALAYASPTGVPLTDPATGLPAEVPGSREKFATAGSIDMSIAGILTALGVIIPGVGAVGAAIGRIKPNQKLAGLVHSVQAVRTAVSAEGTLTPEKLDSILTEVNANVVGLEKAIQNIKADK